MATDRETLPLRCVRVGSRPPRGFSRLGLIVTSARWEIHGLPPLPDGEEVQVLTERRQTEPYEPWQRAADGWRVWLWPARGGAPSGVINQLLHQQTFPTRREALKALQVLWELPPDSVET